MKAILQGALQWGAVHTPPNTSRTPSTVGVPCGASKVAPSKIMTESDRIFRGSQKRIQRDVTI